MSRESSVYVEDLAEIVRRAISRRRQAIVYTLAERMSQSIQQSSMMLTDASEPEGHVWQKIDSLSQLRANVGGRFKNLKIKWVAAGFPLREHRGDRSEAAELNYDGWIELVNWINKQGFDAKLAEEGSKHLFEVREIRKEKQ